MSGRLSGKVALVTGGSKGIGRSTAILFAKEGAKVVLMARGESALNVVAEEIRSGGGDVSVFVGDVSKEDDCSAAVTFCLSTYGALNIAFNNAGIFASAPFSQISEEMVDSIMGTNVKSVIFCFKYQIPAMALNKDGGSIIVNSSVMSQRAQTAFSTAGVYAASKANVDMLVRYGAIEGAEHGIRVNAVNPGIVDTPLWGGMPPETLQGFCKDLQLFGRATTPDEIARSVLYLASDDSTMVTGSMHVMDGRWGLKA